jgi:hypothetical protein
VLDQIISFRRFLRDQFGLQMREELKAGYLIHNSGPFEHLGLSTAARMRIFRMALRLQPKLGLETFAIVVDKDEMVRQKMTSQGAQKKAWQLAYERLERYTSAKHDTCMVFPDEGVYDMIRALLREKRRISYVPSRFGTAPLSRPASFILEDPSVRRSSESYFVQLADLNAYAGHRRLKPEPWFGAAYWDQLGAARVRAVSKYANDPLGIKVWPPTKKEAPT